ncbi:MAG: hypothetical protein ACTSYQ_03285 [Candidatus Odinarchaeia archaeon]
MSHKIDRIILKITQDGLAEKIENITEPDSKDVLFLIDEVNKTDYLYIGESVGFIHKRAAMRVANSLKKFGYQLDNSIIGRHCKKLVIIDKTEKELSANEEENFLQLLKNKKLSEPPKISTNNVEVSNNVKSVEKIIRPINEAIENMDKEKTTKTPEDNDGYEKLGILISSILTVYPELKITKVKNNKYVIEAPIGELCSLQVKKNKLVISPQSTFGGEENKLKIQQRFVVLSSKL